MLKLNLFAFLLIIFPPNMPVVETGLLSQYAVGVMPGVVEARQGWNQLPDDLSGIDGFVAVWDCDLIGQTALLSIETPVGWSDYEKVMISDCSGHESTTAWMVSQNVIFEISGELAVEHDVVCLCPLNGRVIWLGQ